MKKIKGPDFICVGAQKAGTSWLYERLRSHPEFSMTPVKELHYFDRSQMYPSPSHLSIADPVTRLADPRVSRKALQRISQALAGEDVEEVRWLWRYFCEEYSDDWYLSLFEDMDGISGDLTPSYSILEEEDVRKMYSIVPDTKIIFLIRNPIERAWSMYRYIETLGGSIDCENLESFMRFVNSEKQERRSDYLRTIDLYQKYFGSDSVFIGFYDAIKEKPEELIAGILDFVGASKTEFTTNYREVNNRSRGISLPENYRLFLIDKYRSDIENLAIRFGSYAIKWNNGIIEKEIQSETEYPAFVSINGK